ncbi:unnamed protein product [Linum tenue]|uniref:Uncharacterized protein n=1 Tax=Linum tenue TaxID=586396 RepID=A0AAV0PAC4_9ROSI|nr:unnamed protein product [Linum tenue]
MEGHDLIGATNKVPADEHNRKVTGTTVSSQGLLDLPATGDLVELVDGGVDTKVEEQGFDGVAHAARALAEHHHRPLRRQLENSIHFGLIEYV